MFKSLFGSDSASQAFGAPNINIVDANYGNNCVVGNIFSSDVARNNIYVRNKIKKMCNGNQQCAVNIDSLNLWAGEDPIQNCIKNLNLKYTCGKNPIKSGLTMLDGTTVNIACEKFTPRLSTRPERKRREHFENISYQKQVNNDNAFLEEITPGKLDRRQGRLTENEYARGYYQAIWACLPGEDCAENYGLVYTADGRFFNAWQ